MKLLGIEADNPFSLFLILILLLAANGTFNPKAAQAEEPEEEAEEEVKRPAWQTRPNRPLFRRIQPQRNAFGRISPLRKLRSRKELAIPFARVMPLGR